MTGPDERNPLARALDEAGNGPEARAYSIPVGAVRTRARRRRARRTGVTSGLVVLVIGAIAGGAYAGLPGGGGKSPIGPAPGPNPPVTSVADWPAQFLRCGQRAGDPLPNVGEPMTLTLVDASSSVAVGETWNASVVADVPTAPPGQVAVVWATDLSVVSNGVIVGVQEGPTAPPLSEPLNQRPQGLQTNPFPVTTPVRLGLASCDQYPSGRGSPDLAPGTYTLVVTQTVSYAAPGAVQAVTDVRSSVLTTVTITAPEAPTTADPTVCGAPVEAIAALASPESNPAPIVLSTGFHPTPGPSYQYYPVTPRLTNDGPAALAGLSSEPTVVAVRDGVVVGRAQQSGNRIDLGSLAPGDAHDFASPPLAERCPGVDEPAWGGPGLPAGDYELWVVVDVTAADPEVGSLRAATGPIAWSVSEPLPVTPATAASDPVGELFPCGQPTTVIWDMFTEMVLSVTATLPADGWVSGVATMPPWTAQLRTNGVTATSGVVDGSARLAFTDANGTVVGLTTSGDWTSNAVTLRPGEPLTLGGYGWPAPCRPDGSLGGGGAGVPTTEWLPAGTYTAYPFVQFEPSGSGDISVVVGKPSQVTFTGP